MKIDFAPYAYLLDASSWHMDDLHVQMLHDLIMEHRPRVVVEVGSYRGRSAVAYLAALDAGAEFVLHLVEPRPMPSLFRLIRESGHAERVTFHETPFWDLELAADFVFVDANHGWPALADTLAASCRGAEVIALHDTRGWENGYKGVWGSHLAAKLLSQTRGRTWGEDAERRPGMKTERGFGWSVRDL